MQKLIIDVDKALKNQQISEWVEDLLDHIAIEHVKKHGTFVPWEKMKQKIEKKLLPKK